MGINKEWGLIGLGKMGGNLALHALEKGMKVVGYDINGAHEEFLKAGLIEIKSFSDFRDQLSSPRIILMYVPAGPTVDTLLEQLVTYLNNGDIIVDGGNSYWGDSIRRYWRLKSLGIRFVDLGTSGGVEGARKGACFMAGGDREVIDIIEPILKELAVPDGYVHAGAAGTGHFTKLVHNGIEFGMLQSIAEGMDLLEHYHEKLDIAEVLRCWRHGSVIRSWLIDLMETMCRSKDGIETVPPYVEDTGEVYWLVEDALHMEVPTPVIAQSVMQLLSSRDEKKYWARAIAMMRHGFGGHPFNKSGWIAQERRMGRIGGFVEPHP